MITGEKSDKRAWIRILESAIAVMLMIGFFTIITMKHVALPDISEEVYQLERAILKEVSDNEIVRQYVLNNDAQAVHDFVMRRLPMGVSSAIRICDTGTDADCSFPTAGTPNSYPVNLEEPEIDVYVDDYLVSTTLEGGDAKLVRLFVWFEEPEDVGEITCIELCDGVEINDECSEDCDGAIMPLEKCNALGEGYVLGSLACSGECVYDKTDCDKCDVGDIVFVGNPVIKEGYIQFETLDSEIDNSFYIETYDVDGNFIGSEEFISAYVGALAYTEDLLFPSEGLITIRYNEECQDFF